MNFGIETHRGFVNTWECDLNNHLNVQFYWKRFADALEVYSHLTGQPALNWKDRHVRYHDELASASDTIIRSSLVAGPDPEDGQESGQIAHVLTNGVTGKLSATAVDTLIEGNIHQDFDTADFPDAARPRSLQIPPLDPVATRHAFQKGNGLISHLSVVSPQECNAQGFLSDQHHISRFSDAASHFWHHMGVSTKWLKDNGCGSVAVEMKVTRHKPVPVGTVTQITTWLDTIFGKSFSFRHQVMDLKSGEPLYSGAVTALLMDFATRRATELPSMIKDRA